MPRQVLAIASVDDNIEVTCNGECQKITLYSLHQIVKSRLILEL